MNGEGAPIPWRVPKTSRSCLGFVVAGARRDESGRERRTASEPCQRPRPKVELRSLPGRDAPSSRRILTPVTARWVLPVHRNPRHLDVGLEPGEVRRLARTGASLAFTVG